MKEQILKLVGASIRELRKEKGLSQEQLGELADFHFSYIGKMERGEINITLLNLERICKALNVTIHQLFLFAYDPDKWTEKEIHIQRVIQLLHDRDIAQVRKARNIVEELFR